jgi:hypothetical protein
MEPAIADICMCAGSAQAVWEKLEKRYGQKNNYARIFQLQTEIHQAKQQPGQSITEVLNYIEKGEMKFDCINQIPLTLRNYKGEMSKMRFFNFLPVLTQVMKH